MKSQGTKTPRRTHPEILGQTGFSQWQKKKVIQDSLFNTKQKIPFLYTSKEVNGHDKLRHKDAKRSHLSSRFVPCSLGKHRPKSPTSWEPPNYPAAECSSTSCRLWPLLQQRIILIKSKKILHLQPKAPPWRKRVQVQIHLTKSNLIFSVL